MNIQQYLSELYPKIGSPTLQFNLPLKQMLQKLGNLLQGESHFNKPELLGSGVESRVWDLNNDKVLKIGPDYYYNNDAPFYSSAGREILPQLEGRLQPENVEPLSYGKVPQSAHIFPKATVFDDTDFPDAFDNPGNWAFTPVEYRMDDWAEHAGHNPNPLKRRMARVGAAATLADDWESFDREPQSIFAKSYDPYDLASMHPFNLGYAPNQGVVSVDSSAGLAPHRADVDLFEYPRQGYLEGNNILERWADEVLTPKSTNMLVGPVARKLLATYPREITNAIPN